MPGVDEPPEAGPRKISTSVQIPWSTVNFATYCT